MSRGPLDPIGGRSPYPHAVCVERETRPVCVHGYVMAAEHEAGSEAGR